MKFNINDSDNLMKLVDRSNPKLKTIGNLCMTPSHLVFIGTEPKYEIWIYYSLILSVEKQPLNISGSPILIKCKHFLNCLFIISKEKDAQAISTALLQYSRPSKIQDLLCFKSNDHLKFLNSTALNKKIFQVESEYSRMGVPNNEWAASDVNFNYEICDTYPHIVYVPNTANDVVLKGSSNFRSRGRLPVLSYLHSNGASICRCSQPLSGLNSRSLEDEQMLQLILETNKSSKFMYVVDTRPKINAMANKAQGKGYENENNYSNIQFHFIGIENIHVMRSSLSKLVEASEVVYPANASFLTGMEKCEWLKHIKAVIDTSLFITEAISNQNINVIVHCSDGWDRTAQTCALSSLLLDSYYRTIHGFQILIEKEWLTFGHKFSHRSGHTFDGEHSTKETSPIFLQFLECVWQISQQFPCAFEFNEKFLIKLHEHVYSCQFGTFIGNCEKERLDLRISEVTFSLWDYIQHRINDFINPLYVPNSIFSRQVIKPDTRPQKIKFWKGMYNRFDLAVHSNENLNNTLSVLHNNTSFLNDYAKLLKKRCSKIKSSLNETESISSQDKADSLTDSYIKIEDNLSDEIEKLQMESDFLLTNLDSPTKLSSNDERPITFDIDIEQLNLDWISSRSNCSCSMAFDYASAKLNCSKCGKVFCERCIENGKYVKSQASTKLLFICQSC